MKQYNPSEIEPKWQQKWEKDKIYSPDLDQAKKPFYNLMMFPYPSAEGMHVGNMYAFTGADVYGRFKRMQGNDVFEPIGLDGFGIHSENYAIKVGRHPKEQANLSEQNFYRQLHSIGNSYDWTRTVETYKPGYYKWTQWLFTALFKAGLAYRAKAKVNWCPSDKTVLADEQVIDGKCERDGAVVEKRELEQWFFKITDYAERLLANIPKLNWSEKVKVAQENWIGKSEGARIRFKIKELRLKNESVEVFTTRPDTLYGATFLVISPELAQKWLDLGWKAPQEVVDYVEKSLKRRGSEAENRDKSGVFAQFYAVNPVNNEKIPVWVADYILAGYGTGAIMAVPAHDQRDFEFAQKYKLPIKTVIHGIEKDIDSSAMPQSDKIKEAYVGEGEIVNSKNWDGSKTPESINKVISWLEDKGIGKKEVNYHLRDWLISRQRYWGPPIPLIFCENCAERIKNSELGIRNDKYSKGEIENPGWFPVPESDLPVLLPEVSDWKPKGTGKSPLANIDSFVNTKCPSCGGPAKRETDVSDTFLDSAWYFLRYACTDIESKAYDIERLKKWLPVNMYIGGAEHSVLHLLYSRFIAMVLSDLKLVDFEEPFERFYAHGLIVKDGAKMSKSKGNVVIPDEYIKKFGADTLRMYLMFLGPFSQGGDFRDSGIEGMNRFLKRVWKIIVSQEEWKVGEVDTYLKKLTWEITEEVENLRFNTAISRLMMYYNFLVVKQRGGYAIFREEIVNFIKLIAPFAPHLAEEVWELLGEKSSVHIQSWPLVDKEQLKDLWGFTIVIQVNGKTRSTMDMERLLSQEEVEGRAKEMVKNHLENKKILKVIYVEGKIMNFVTE